ILLWADQICINQSDTEERSHQVGFMGAIYRCARDVAISLSTKAYMSTSALQFICTVFDNGMRPQPQVAPTYVNIFGRSLPQGLLRHLRLLSSAHMDSFRLQNLISELLDRKRPHWNGAWDDVLNFMRHPWWTRAWTFQEFVLAQSTYFIYGGVAMPWQMVAIVLLCYFNAEELRGEDENAMTEEGYHGNRSICS
ncbi:hypothetical protein EK21DRAFT_71189, partial [Setomelanomma holmii]